MRVLNIANGDAVINIMKKANIMGDFLPWRDFLHEGPVPQNFTLPKLSKIRAHFIDEQGFGEFEEIYLDFEKRNATLADYRSYDKIILWFEPDLYDQLQLIQILAWFAEQTLIETPQLSLISSNHYLGESSKQQILTLSLYDEKIMPQHLALAKRAWSAFRQLTPLPWFNLLQEDSKPLPYLKSAIKRILEEYPNNKNGLSRSAHETLLIISRGEEKPYEIFKAYQKQEERKFMGDVIFWKILDDFKKYKLIFSKENGEKLTLTPLGQKVLNGKENWLQIKPIQRWIGGVNLTPDNLWCWDIKKQTIGKYYYSSPLKMLLPVKHPNL